MTSPSHPQAAALAAGLEALGLALAAHQQNQLLGYLDLIAKWNRVHNLTAIRDPAEMLRHHLLDSLAVVPPLQRYLAGRTGRVLDVGSGAGLPGAVLAICAPGALQVECVDTVAKKVAFIQQAAGALRVSNLRGVHRRVEELGGQYDVVCARAFASLADFTRWSAASLAEEGVWLAMKGKHPAAEIAALGDGIDVFHVEQLQVPGLAAERCLVWMRRKKRLVG